MLDLGPKTPNNEGHSCSIDLSRDGRTLYLSLLPIETDTTVTHRIGRLGLPADLALPDASPEPQAIYEAPPSPLPGQDVPYSGVTWDPSVDDDSTYLYLVRRGVDTIDELVRACGHGLAWADGMLLGNGFDSRGRATGSILSIDPATGAVRTLVTGHHPQGR